MKNLFLLLAFSLILSNCNAQQSKEGKQKTDVPETVKTSFFKQFPDAKRAEWSLEKAGEYEVEFMVKRVESSAVFDESGNLIETETEISKSELPQLVKDAISKNFIGYRMDEFEKTVAKGLTTYEVQAKKDGKTYEISFDETGKTLTNEEVTGKEEDKD